MVQSCHQRLVNIHNIDGNLSFTRILGTSKNTESFNFTHLNPERIFPMKIEVADTQDSSTCIRAARPLFEAAMCMSAHVVE